MKTVRRILGEIWENLDLYLTVILAAVVAVLDVFQIAGSEVISAATLATLALLAYSILSNRKSAKQARDSTDQLAAKFETLKSAVTGKNRVSDVLGTGYPDLTEQIRTAKRVSVLGSTLSSTISRYYPDFVQLVQHGGSLRFLVSAPDAQVQAMQVLRSPSIDNVEAAMDMILSNLARAKTIEKQATESGQLQIRTIRYLASYSLVIIQGEDGTSRAYVKVLTFQSAHTLHPTLVVDSRSDPSWYRFFSDQFERLWSEAEQAE